VLLVAPVPLHRVLFRRHRLGAVVSEAHHYAITGLVLLALALAGVAAIIFDAVLGAGGAWVAGILTLLALASFWFLLPLRERRSRRPD